jgi:hypothetical protein
MAIWNILWPFGIFYGHLEYFMAICFIISPFWLGILYQEKAGKPARQSSNHVFERHCQK